MCGQTNSSLSSLPLEHPSVSAGCHQMHSQKQVRSCLGPLLKRVGCRLLSADGGMLSGAASCVRCYLGLPVGQGVDLVIL